VAIGTTETLVIAGVLNVAVCVGVVLVPSVRAVRMNGPVEVTVAEVRA
jgi:hypothetical protein